MINDVLLRTLYSINNFFRTLIQGLLFYSFAIIAIDIYTQTLDIYTFISWICLYIYI